MFKFDRLKLGSDARGVLRSDEASLRAASVGTVREAISVADVKLS